MLTSGTLSGDAGIGRVARWLTAIGLLEHAQKFIEAGLDDLDFIAEVGLSEADVDKLGIEKLGHRKKLTALYRVREFLGPVAPVSDGNVSAGGGGEAEADEKGTEADSEAGSDEESDEGSGDSGSDDDEGSGDDSDDSGSDDEDSGDDSDES